MSESVQLPSRFPAPAIRPMQAVDLDSVLAIDAALPTAPHWPRQVWLDALDPSGNPPRLALVAESDGVILGFFLLSLLPPEAELEFIAIALAAQRRGIGRQLLEAAINTVRIAGVTTILGEVRPSNPAVSFYLQAGFRETGRRPGYYTDPKEDAILMARTLP